MNDDVVGNIEEVAILIEETPAEEIERLFGFLSRAISDHAHEAALIAVTISRIHGMCMHLEGRIKDLATAARSKQFADAAASVRRNG